jgi:hypothetical protein
MFRKFDDAVRGVQHWCEQQARREAPYMPATALATGLGFPLFTALQDHLDSTPKDSSWPFSLFLTGLFLHLAVGWGYEYQSLWKFNKPIGRAAIACCAAFWVVVGWYLHQI